MSDIGKCEHCKATFEYRLVHNGFNESAFAYCDHCGRAAILKFRDWPNSLPNPLPGPILPEVEPAILPCECGGRFKGGAEPRCPACHRILSAIEAAEWIEANAPGTKKGWRWQRMWTGPVAPPPTSEQGSLRIPTYSDYLYAIIIEGNSVLDNWAQ